MFSLFWQNIYLHCAQLQCNEKINVIKYYFCNLAKLMKAEPVYNGIFP